MADFFEQAINNYSGLASETKPTIAAGNRVPNGSRWREVDTGRVLFFDINTDAWYVLSTALSPIAGAGPVVDIRSLDLFEKMLKSLKKIEYHLSLASDADLTDYEV